MLVANDLAGGISRWGRVDLAVANSLSNLRCRRASNCSVVQYVAHPFVMSFIV